MPDFLTHYYEAENGPFFNLSDLPMTDAEAVLQAIRQKGATFASQRREDYLTVRHGLETLVRDKFCQKGGLPVRQRPHYFVLGACPWLLTWYRKGGEVRIPLAEFPAGIISFTYGDTFPAMRYDDGKPYRKQVYTLAEMPGLVEQFGLPQDWNADGKLGPDRYIEAQVWDDGPLQLHLRR